MQKGKNRGSRSDCYHNLQTDLLEGLKIMIIYCCHEKREKQKNILPYEAATHQDIKIEITERIRF